MLEWYEAYADWEVVADRAERLLRSVAARPWARDRRSATPWKRESLGELDPGPRRASTSLGNRTLAVAGSAPSQDAGMDIPDEPNWAGARGLPGLQARRADADRADASCIDYPVELLARSPSATASTTVLVERFEAFANGMEVGNAFTELNDPDDQRASFEDQVRHAAAGDEKAPPFDTDYIYSLEHGMPPTGGIGIGIDRLTMLSDRAATIREVVLFPALK